MMQSPTIQSSWLHCY